MKSISAWTMLFFLFLPGLLKSQDYPQFPTVAGDVVYEDVVECDLPKKVIFDNLKLWVAYSFKSAQDVIQFEDYEAGRLIIKGNFKESVTMGIAARTVTSYFTLQLDVRDKKYRCRFFDMSSRYDNTTHTFLEMNQISSGEKRQFKTMSGFVRKMVASADERILSMIEDIRKTACTVDDF